jgi:cyclopropane fatty-acyl-phospholipid synthase-like methyltransferase
MLDAILRAYQSSTYDFRAIAHPADPLQARFAAWVDYYRLKWAIAQVLQPRTILEIGVRYGYSAHAFLDACPQSAYRGIDLDSTIAGGVKGAIDWAAKILQPFQADLIIANTQAMTSFPGETYDLIHVDGQQDGDSSFHDLTLAIAQGHYILVDGYHWTTPNFVAVNDFLLQHRDRVDWYAAIPGYAGELIIKVATAPAAPPAQTSRDLRHTYDHTYYTQSCHGYDAFATYQGQRLLDERLQAVATIAGLKQSGRVLDLGCGRGELSYYFAQQGFEVTAIDYSPTAIDLAQQCLATAPALAQRVQLICADVNQVELELGTYDLAIATDLIEHLAPAELTQLYQRLQQWLKPDGLLIIHTFPNRWYYQYDYARKRRQAKALGAYLPSQPRSRDEQRMHINEQSPRVLQRQLAASFAQVQVWFSGQGENYVGGSLVQPFSRRDLAAAPSLYAIAARQPGPTRLRDRLCELLQTQPIPSPRLPWGQGLRPAQLRLRLLATPTTLPPGVTIEIPVQLDNASAYKLHSGGAYPIYWAFRWLDPTGAIIVENGQRTRLIPPSLPPTAIPPAPTKNHIGLRYSTQSYFVRIVTPTQPGPYQLRVTLVQERVRWFDRAPLHCFQDISILIAEAAHCD